MQPQSYLRNLQHDALVCVAFPIARLIFVLALAFFLLVASDFQAYKLPPEGFDSAIDFVDQLDLDSDGISEVFVTQHGFDAYGYSIYKKSRGRWRQVYTTTGDAC